jgi:hypothetical protein
MRDFLVLVKFVVIIATAVAAITIAVTAVITGHNQCTENIHLDEQYLHTQARGPAFVIDEIDTLLADNHCNEITPEKLRKVLHDMYTVKP